MLLYFTLLYTDDDDVSCLVEREGLGESERPAVLEGSSDHCTAGRRRRARQTERVLQVQTTHVDRDIDEVDRCVEERQTRHVGNGHVPLRLHTALYSHRRPVSLTHASLIVYGTETVQVTPVLSS